MAGGAVAAPEAAPDVLVSAPAQERLGREVVHPGDAEHAIEAPPPRVVTTTEGPVQSMVDTGRSSSGFGAAASSSERSGRPSST